MTANNQPIERQESTLDVVERFILGTLLYTPQVYVRNEKYVEIKAYAPGTRSALVRLISLSIAIINIFKLYIKVCKLLTRYI